MISFWYFYFFYQKQGSSYFVILAQKFLLFVILAQRSGVLPQCLSSSIFFVLHFKDEKTILTTFNYLYFTYILYFPTKSVCSMNGPLVMFLAIDENIFFHPSQNHAMKNKIS